jgi:predicted HicB family RNase H-like nuclease
MTALTHKGYIATIEIDEEAGIFSGIVLDLADTTLHFEGKTVKDLRHAFADTVKDYETWCLERGKKPEKPYSGKLALRLAPQLHCKVATAAARAGRSINAFIADTLER